MIDKLRKITRLLAIPLLILWWSLFAVQSIILFICCLLDLRIDEWDYCLEGLTGLIKDWIKDGAMTL